MDFSYNKSTLLAGCLISLLAGCSTMSTPNRLPDGGPTTLEVYEGAQNPSATSDTQASSEGDAIAPSERYNIEADLQAERDPAPWTRDQSNEQRNLFPRIPNMELTGYVYPHLSPRGHPVPGYTTSFPVYGTVHYALPGEAAPLPPREAED